MVTFDKSKLKIEKVNNVINATYEDEDIYKKGTDINLKTLKAVDDYRAEYVGKALEFAADEAGKMFKSKGNEKVEKILYNFPFGLYKRDSIDISVDKEKTFRSPTDGKEVTKPSIGIKVNDHSLKVSSMSRKALEDNLKSILAGK